MITRALKVITDFFSFCFRVYNKSTIFFSVLLVLFLINSCKKESNVFPDDVTITFKVYDDRDSLVIGAKISIYDNYQAYQNGILAQNIGYSIDSALSTASGSTFILKPQTDYWILVTYDDVVRSLKLSNINLSDQLDKQDKSTVITSRIKIGPSGGNISFWTDATNQVPISVIFNSTTTNLSTTMPAAPVSIGDPNSLNFNVLPGIYPYYAKGPNNCLWTGSVQVNNGGFKTIQLNTCTTGQISFYTMQSAIPGTYPISVILDNLDNAGQITTPVAAPYSCGPLDPNALNIYRDPNIYTYVAQTADQTRTWTGTFTLGPNGCVSIQLP